MPHNPDGKYCWVVAIFIVDPTGKKILLIDHKKYKTWLDIGGHIEKDETPDEALFRELNEEASLKPKDITILNSKAGYKLRGRKFLYGPAHIDLHDTPQKGKQHIAFVYYAIAKKTDVVCSDEHHAIRWFTKSEIGQRKYKIQADIKWYALEALKKAREYLKNKSAP